MPGSLRTTRHGGCVQIGVATRVSSVLLGELHALLLGIQCAGLLFQKHFAWALFSRFSSCHSVVGSLFFFLQNQVVRMVYSVLLDIPSSCDRIGGSLSLDFFSDPIACLLYGPVWNHIFSCWRRTFNEISEIIPLNTPRRTCNCQSPAV